MKIEGCIEKEIKLLAPITIDKKSFSTITVREAVGSDCELASVAKLKENPTDVMINIIRSVIVDIPGASRAPTLDEIRKLPVEALENIILEISILSGGDEYEAKFVCENKADGKECGEKFSEKIAKSALLSKKRINPIEVCDLPRGIRKDGKVLKSVRYHPIDGIAQENALRDRGSGKFVQFTTQLLCDCIVDADGVTLELDDISKMSTLDRKVLTEAIQGSATESKTVLHRNCPKCGGKVTHFVNILDFLV